MWSGCCFMQGWGMWKKDYFIKELSLRDCVMEALAANKQFLIQNGVSVSTEKVRDTVYSDEKWVVFIMNQIIINSVKYSGGRPPVIAVESTDMGGYVVLAVTDNGAGIKESEIDRIFDKGFVGSNGRAGRERPESVVSLQAAVHSGWGFPLKRSQSRAVYNDPS